MEANKSRERFVALAEKRVTKALKDIRLIGNLSNKSNYSYTEKDVIKILKALKNELKKVEQKFNNKGQDEEVIFKL